MVASALRCAEWVEPDDGGRGAPAVLAGSPAASITAPDTLLARFAVDSLIEEVRVTPKPALVDQRGSGAHRDLDLMTMLRSALALRPAFAALSRVSRHRMPSVALREELGQIGRDGETAMMRATSGSNAHRGAIWIVGLLVAGAAICESLSSKANAAEAPGALYRPYAPLAPGDLRDLPGGTGVLAARVCAVGAQLACLPDRFAPAADTNGERVRQRYHVGGARREAQDGFPHVIGVGLPALHAARANGVAEDAARVDTLLSIMASLDDTCLLHRAGRAGLQAGQHGARRVLALGGSSTARGRAELAGLERTLLTLNASPGGSADLLAATLFIDKLVQHDTSGSAVTWNT